MDRYSKSRGKHTRKCKTDPNEKSVKTLERTVEEIADRYYQVAFAVAKARGVSTEANFDMGKEQERKFNVYKVLMRTRE